MKEKEEWKEKRMQVRCKFQKKCMHVQGIDPTYEGNRAYGMAHELRALPIIIEWLGEQQPTRKSPASGDLLYIEFTIAEYENDIFQMLIEGDELNHPKGACLDMHMESSTSREVIAFAKATGLLVAGIGEPYNSDDHGFNLKEGEEE